MELNNNPYTEAKRKLILLADKNPAFIPYLKAVEKRYIEWTQKKVNELITDEKKDTLQEYKKNMFEEDEYYRKKYEAK